MCIAGKKSVRLETIRAFVAFNCVRCGATLATHESDSGRMGRCPGCHDRMVIPRRKRRRTRIKMACPHCDRRLRIKVKYSGRRVRCPDCSGAIRVPGLKKSKPAPERHRRTLEIDPPKHVQPARSLEPAGESSGFQLCDSSDDQTVANAPTQELEPARPASDWTEMPLEPETSAPATRRFCVLLSVVAVLFVGGVLALIGSQLFGQRAEATEATNDSEVTTSTAADDDSAAEEDAGPLDPKAALLGTWKLDFDATVAGMQEKHPKKTKDMQQGKTFFSSLRMTFTPETIVMDMGMGQPETRPYTIKSVGEDRMVIGRQNQPDTEVVFEGKDRARFVVANKPVWVFVRTESKPGAKVEEPVRVSFGKTRSTKLTSEEGADLARIWRHAVVPGNRMSDGHADAFRYLLLKALPPAPAGLEWKVDDYQDTEADPKWIKRDRVDLRLQKQGADAYTPGELHFHMEYFLEATDAPKNGSFGIARLSANAIVGPYQVNVGRFFDAKANKPNQQAIDEVLRSIEASPLASIKFPSSPEPHYTLEGSARSDDLQRLATLWNKPKASPLEQAERVMLLRKALPLLTGELKGYTFWRLGFSSQVRGAELRLVPRGVKKPQQNQLVVIGLYYPDHSNKKTLRAEDGQGVAGKVRVNAVSYGEPFTKDAAKNRALIRAFQIAPLARMR